MSEPLDPHSLDRLFRTARTRNAWREEQLPEETWRELYELVKFGPTSANTTPARFVFVVSEEAKRRLAPHLSTGNRAKSMKAPAIAIIGRDLDFADKIPLLNPDRPEQVKSWFANPAGADRNAMISGTLQGAYLVLAARALGLDAGPMGGFDNQGVDREFFAGTNIKSIFICALGHGVDEPRPRLPRLRFEDACRIV